jgi:hypothetical protein
MTIRLEDRDHYRDLMRMIQFASPKLGGILPRPARRAETAAVCLALLRGMIRQAQVIVVLGWSDLSEASTPILSAMFETWLQMIHLVRLAADDTAAFECRAFALLEYRESLANGAGDADEIAAADGELTALRNAAPAAVAAMEALRARASERRRNYWNGLNRSDLVREAAEACSDDGVLADFHVLTLWDANYILTPILNIERTGEGPANPIRLGGARTPKEAVDVSYALATQMLVNAWVLVEREWPELGLQPSGPTTAVSDGGPDERARGA